VTVPLWLRMNADRCTANHVLLRFGIGKPPIDVSALAFSMGVDVRYVSRSAWDGAVESDADGTARIYVNTDSSPIRQRFTVAHELGHLLLHEPGSVFRDNFATDAGGIREIQANRFAFSLLIPSWMAQAYTGAPVTDLARLFGVSTAAMEFRIESFDAS
jgi:hypothetical protein